MRWLQAIARKLSWLIPRSSTWTQGQCGAIALRFVYKRLGSRASLDDIWHAIKVPKEALGPGVYSSSSHLMCRDALDRGLNAVNIHARYERGLDLLAKARQQKVEVIFVHGTADPAWRHYSIVEGLDADSVDTFDPANQAFSSMNRQDLLEMWGRLGNEGGGHSLLALSASPSEPARCDGCGTSIPPEIRCPDPGCRKAVPIEPGFLLGCVSKECPEAMWEWIECPYCGTLIEDLNAWSAW
jgi:hypothetical protein